MSKKMKFLIYAFSLIFFFGFPSIVSATDADTCQTHDSLSGSYQSTICVDNLTFEAYEFLQNDFAFSPQFFTRSTFIFQTQNSWTRTGVSGSITSDKWVVFCNSDQVTAPTGLISWDSGNNDFNINPINDGVIGSNCTLFLVEMVKNTNSWDFLSNNYWVNNTSFLRDDVFDDVQPRSLTPLESINDGCTVQIPKLIFISDRSNEIPVSLFHFNYASCGEHFYITDTTLTYDFIIPTAPIPDDYEPPPFTEYIPLVTDCSTWTWEFLCNAYNFVANGLNVFFNNVINIFVPNTEQFGSWFIELKDYLAYYISINEESLTSAMDIISLESESIPDVIIPIMGTNVNVSEKIVSFRPTILSMRPYIDLIVIFLQIGMVIWLARFILSVGVFEKGGES